MEACDYADDCVQYWIDTEGALGWLQRVYCESQHVTPMTTNNEAMLLFVRGNRNLHAMQDLEDAVDCFDEILELADNPKDIKLRKETLQRKGLCLSLLDKRETAITQFDQALKLCDHADPNEKDFIKQLIYNRASCKEALGQYRGALNDYTYVMRHIGRFTSADEGIRRMEEKLGIERPPEPKLPNSQKEKENILSVHKYVHETPMRSV